MFLNLILFLDLSFEFKVRTSVKFLADLRLQFLLQRRSPKVSLSLFSGYNTSTIVVGSAWEAIDVVGAAFAKLKWQRLKWSRSSWSASQNSSPNSAFQQMQIA